MLKLYVIIRGSTPSTSICTFSNCFAVKYWLWLIEIFGYTTSSSNIYLSLVIIINKFDWMCGFICSLLVWATINWSLNKSFLIILLVFLTVNQLQTKILHVGLIDPRVYNTLSHIFIFFILIIKLLISFLTLNVNSIHVPFFNLASKILQRLTCIFIYYCLRKPKWLSFATETTHCKLKVAHTLLCPLKLNYWIYKMGSSIKFYD